MRLTNEMSVAVFAVGKILKGSTRLDYASYRRTCPMSTTSDAKVSVELGLHERQIHYRSISNQSISLYFVSLTSTDLSI